MYDLWLITLFLKMLYLFECIYTCVQALGACGSSKPKDSIEDTLNCGMPSRDNENEM
jgi:hypothetical protein